MNKTTLTRIIEHNGYEADFFHLVLRLFLSKNSKTDFRYNNVQQPFVPVVGKQKDDPCCKGHPFCILAVRGVFSRGAPEN